MTFCERLRSFGLICMTTYRLMERKRESLILCWVKHDKHNFTQNPYEPHWQIPLGVRASG